jgi:hypothetical protein
VDLTTTTAEWTYESAAGSAGSIQLNARRDELPTPFSLPDGTQVPAGAYAATTVQLQHRTPVGRVFVAQAGVQAGGYFDGWRLVPRLSPMWYVSPHWSSAGTMS